MYKRRNGNKGITLISLGIVITILLIITSTIILSANDRYKSEKLDKLANDLQVLTEKTGMYYLENKEYPIKDGGKSATISGVDVYELDLTKMDGLTLNYGSGTDADDYYAIDTSTGTVYYKKGIEGIYNLAQADKIGGIEVVKITTQPQWQSAYEGKEVTFSVEVENETGITYQWYETEEYNGSGTEIAGETSESLIFANVRASDEKYYYCQISYDKDNDNVVDITKKSDVVKLSLKNYIDYKIYGNTVDDISVGDLVTDETDSNYGKYKIPVKVRGANLFNLYYLNKKENYTINSGSGYYSASVKLKSNTTYTVFSKRTEVTDKPERAFYSKVALPTDTVGSVGSFAYYISSSDKFSTNNKKSITTGDDGVIYFVVSGNASQSTLDTLFKYFYFQIVEGTKELEYEPYVEPITTNIYLDEPLRKLEDKEDYIDFKEQKVVRYIKEENGVLSLIEDGPIEEKIELPKVVTFEGITNTMSVETNVQPSKIEAN